MYDPLTYAPDRDARKWAMFCHLGGLARLVFIPLAGVVVPLIIWLARRDEHPFIDRHGREALNFQISISVYWMCNSIVFGVLSWIHLGFLVLPVYAILWLAGIGGSIVGAVRADSGEMIRFPFTIRLLN